MTKRWTVTSLFIDSKNHLCNFIFYPTGSEDCVMFAAKPVSLTTMTHGRHILILWWKESIKLQLKQNIVSHRCHWLLIGSALYIKKENQYYQFIFREKSEPTLTSGRFGLYLRERPLFPTALKQCSDLLWPIHPSKNLNIRNEATWRWCEPTCLCLDPLFDLDPCDLWPWPRDLDLGSLWPLTCSSHVKYTVQCLKIAF